MKQLDTDIQTVSAHSYIISNIRTKWLTDRNDYNGYTDNKMLSYRRETALQGAL